MQNKHIVLYEILRVSRVGHSKIVRLWNLIVFFLIKLKNTGRYNVKRWRGCMGQLQNGTKFSNGRIKKIEVNIQF